MEFYKRCTHCGRKSPSFDNEANLNEWMRDFNWHDDTCCVCDDANSDIAKQYIEMENKRKRVFMNIAVIVFFIIFTACSVLSYLYTH